MRLFPSVTIRIKISFFVLCLLFGALLAKNIPSLFVISSLLALVLFIHELGHLIVIRLFARACSLELSGGGGVTEVIGPSLIFWKRALVHSGGILITAFTALCAQMYVTPKTEVLFLFSLMNVIWFWLNLLPLYPFDMGEMLVDFLYIMFGPVGRKIGALISVAFSILIAVISLKAGILLGAYFSIYCIAHSWRLWQRPQERSFSGQLSSEQQLLCNLKDRWKNGEQSAVLEPLSLLAKKGKDLRVRQKAVGMYANYTLQLDLPREAFAILKEAKDPLLISSLEHMVLAAYKTSHWKEGLFSGREAFQIEQNPFLAAACALLSARLHLKEEALGWLQAARLLGIENVDSLLSSHDFDAVRLITD